MTPQKAIKILQTDFRIYSIEECKEATSMAIQALEKQIPKKPKDIGHFCEIYVCPCCETSILLKPSYCENCGQVLDWSDEE